ncbi:ATP-binding response regulator [Neomegalonema perideroedes]|uniref:ATP-binding response regulator n=1 Tax=Neomegalonema perideroedes TaxID=217219 RepID=UPI000381E1C0|nr:ATP-binding protein [Neomegalonema perideroedes]
MPPWTLEEPQEDPARALAKLRRINEALIRRIDQLEQTRSSAYALSQAAAMLEKEVMARNLDLERLLAQLSAANQELAMAREAADEANRAKSRFLRAASHDLLQPMSAAKLFLSHLSEAAPSPLQQDLIGRIADNFESAEELIQTLLEIAQLDSRKLEINIGPVSLGRLFQRLSTDLQAQAEARGLDLRFVPSSRVVLSDPAYLRRIAVNLVSNALKYTDAGRVIVGVRRARPDPDEPDEEEGDSVWLEVHDTGPGIAPEDRERVFNEFERLSRADRPGTGLGLSIVRRACLQLGHDLELHSALGRGSLFRVRLPLAPEGIASSPHRRAPESAIPPPAPAESFAGGVALVVENDPAMRHALALSLEGLGFKVFAGAGACEAVAAIRRIGLRPDLLLSDYRLDHGETGAKAILEIRAAFRSRIPALLLSGERLEEIRAEAPDLPADVDFLAKPFAEADLRARLRRLAPPSAGDSA